MRQLLSVVWVPILFFLLSLLAQAEGQEVKTMNLRALNDLLGASQGKVVVLDFWFTR